MGFPLAIDKDLEDDNDSQLEFEVGGQETPSATFDKCATNVDKRDASENARLDSLHAGATLSPKWLKTIQTEEDFHAKDTIAFEKSTMIVALNVNQISVSPVPTLDNVPIGMNGTASANVNGANVTAEVGNAAMLYILQKQQQQTVAGTLMYNGTPMYVYHPNGSMPLSPQQQ